MKYFDQITKYCRQNKVCRKTLNVPIYHNTGRFKFSDNGAYALR